MRNEHLPAVGTFVAFIFGVSLLNLLNPSDELSTLERRDLAQFPTITTQRVLDGDVTDDVALYLQDQAAFRDQLRFVKSFVERQLFRKDENNGVYVVDNRIYDKFFGIEHRLIDRAAERLNDIAASIDPSEVYLAVIPTKAQMLDRDRYLLSNQAEIADTLTAAIDATYVDLMGLAVPGNEHLYYATDPHWTTAGAIDAYRTLARAMGYEPILGYQLEVATTSYIGSEYGRAASWRIPRDTIHVAHNETLDAMSICRFATLEDTDCYDSVYVELSDDSMDLYDMFLGGLAPIIVITNPQAPAGTELVIFKDSYAHAVAPFLAQHFSQVTLVDLRYVQRQLILDNVNFEGATTLFLYSTSVLNTDPRIVN